jgi:hypothetical protein
MHYAMLNGDPKATLIESMDGRVVLVGPHAEKHEVFTVKDAIEKAKELKWEINIEHLFGEGTRRRLAELLKEKSKEV